MEDNRSREELESIAKERLFPSITNPNYLVLRRRAQLFRQWSSQLPEEGLRVLDLGGRYQAYRPLFQSRVAQYIALDILQTKLVDVVGRGEQLPFASEAFDLVIATQVFEYFPEPSVVAKQIHAILKLPDCGSASVAGRIVQPCLPFQMWRLCRKHSLWVDFAGW
ncbi:MAG: Methyltransferase type 11 [Acidobacteriaceae bacterium]|jgi:SAM-dependent methyltransferase|nr:Methyltransferase type 11 [Acidobacteriaceae bacterium]